MNIFEGAKFGDKFLTRDGEIAIYISIRIEPLYDAAFLIIEGEKITDEFYLNGKIKRGYSGNDIVSRYQDPIDEDKLDELAEEWNDWDDNSNETEWSYTHKDICKAYKAGYRKAKEE